MTERAQQLLLPAPTEAPDQRPLAYLSDLDGTLALMNGRGPYDWDRVGEDLPNMPVIRVLRAVKLIYPVGFLTGRMEQCRRQTESWITANVCDHAYACFCRSPMWMRQDDDFRPDPDVKFEMYTGGDRYLEPVIARYRALGVLDDRGRVVRMWRERLGLTVLDVAGFNG
jgi:hypothetical protein